MASRVPAASRKSLSVTLCALLTVAIPLTVIALVMPKDPFHLNEDAPADTVPVETFPTPDSLPGPAACADTPGGCPGMPEPAPEAD